MAKRLKLPETGESLPGRDQALSVSGRHHALGTSYLQPYPDGSALAIFGMGCFWGAERLFWRLPGVFSTAVGYSGGHTPNPTYEEVCSGNTAHAEVVLVVYFPEKLSYADLLVQFWQGHDPTQGMRQGNDLGTQYRSLVVCADDQTVEQTIQSRTWYQGRLSESGLGEITTEIRGPGKFYFAEEYHQQYLSKNPAGYCGLGGCGVPYEIR